ncbi:MAG TPA: glycoside hydrolase family 13 protein [Clostridiales bacterium]|nr:glycoside hydrolase family 13 protein [Clostridiales bacterium]HQH63289.1 glycoside hydrolase family 13 protein [Clostridiales bacterium]HQK72660.1 glycoside hydrolase family 13 protein [Clostridiales bacterium]
MQYIPFNSRKPYHKSPVGAARAGSATLFRLIFPRSMGVTGVTLAVRGPDGFAENLPLSWEAMQGGGEEWWRAAYTPGTEGLYYYSFAYTAASGNGRVTQSDAGLGMLSGEGGEWQLTVCRADFRTPDWLKGSIMYQIFPDRFARGKDPAEVPDGRTVRGDWGGEPLWDPDEKGRVSRSDYFGGNFDGIIAHLGRLEELGVGCIYLNPVFEAHSPHRYDTADYEKIDPLLGDTADFERLCAEAAKRGMAVILDGVFSHTGDDSVYFNKYGRYPGLGACQSQSSPYYEWYRFEHWPDRYKCWWNVDILPEINEESPSFMRFVNAPEGIAASWLRRGARGWRLDVADELPDAFLDGFRRAVKSTDPDALILGEVWENASNKTSYGKTRRYLLGGQLDSVMNYPFCNAVFAFIAGSGAQAFFNAIQDIIETYPAECVDTLMNHIGTHDTVRALTRLAAGDPGPPGARFREKGTLTAAQRERGLKLMRLASTLQYSLPGVPCVYYGDEAGLEGGHDPYNRRCYPWGAEDEGLLEHYRLLGSIRVNSPAFADGDFEPVFADGDFGAFTRACPRQKLLVAANCSDSVRAFGLPECGGCNVLMAGGGSVENGRVFCGPYSAMIIELDRQDGGESRA